MRKTAIFMGLLAGASLAATAMSASAQTRAAAPRAAAPAAAAPKVFAFPEAQGAPPPPGAPTMEEALAAYLGGRNNAQPGAAPGAPRPAPPPPPGRTLPPILTVGPVPDKSHINFVLPEDIPWQGREGQNQTYNIFGSPTEPGPYIQLMKWWPGAYSGPHMHPNTRYAIVLSGTWWVSDSATQDKTKTYPLQAGTFVTEPPYTYHWDGARNEPAVLILWGNGPSPNISVDEKGLPRIRNANAPAGGAAPPAGRPGN